MKKLKKMWKEISKIRSAGRDTKKAKKKGKKLIESLRYIGELNKFAKEHREKENHRVKPVSKRVDNDLNFQDLIDIIMDSEVTDFDATQLGRTDISKVIIDRITVEFNEPLDPYNFISSKDVDMGKIKSILVERRGEAEPAKEEEE